MRRRMMLNSGKSEIVKTEETRKLVSRTLSGEYVNKRFTTVGMAAFASCISLTVVDLPNVLTISAQAFRYCESLVALILRNETMCKLDNVQTLQSTPIASGTGYIYVPSNLVEEYKATTNWSIYANQFRAIEDYPDICGGE